MHHKTKPICWILTLTLTAPYKPDHNLPFINVWLHFIYFLYDVSIFFDSNKNHIIRLKRTSWKWCINYQNMCVNKKDKVDNGNPYAGIRLTLDGTAFSQSISLSSNFSAVKVMVIWTSWYLKPITLGESITFDLRTV